VSRHTATSKTPEESPKRGRPPKFGRPGHVVSVTLPDDTLQALNRVDPDTGWAIVKLLEREPRRVEGETREPDVELAQIGTRRSLIVVNRSVFKVLPGVNLIPLNETRAFLALDLELAVIDRLSDKSIDAREREALESLRAKLGSWRRDHGLAFHSRSIIVVEQISGGNGRSGTRSRRAPA
jgi:hypothetical protein